MQWNIFLLYIFCTSSYTTNICFYCLLIECKQKFIFIKRILLFGNNFFLKHVSGVNSKSGEKSSNSKKKDKAEVT